MARCALHPLHIIKFHKGGSRRIRRKSVPFERLLDGDGPKYRGVIDKGHRVMGGQVRVGDGIETGRKSNWIAIVDYSKSSLPVMATEAKSRGAIGFTVVAFRGPDVRVVDDQCWRGKMSKSASRILSIPKNRPTGSVMGGVAKHAYLSMTGIKRVDLGLIGYSRIPGGQIVLVTYIGNSWTSSGNQSREQEHGNNEEDSKPKHTTPP